MADTIIDGTQFNVQIIKYSAPKANSSGGKSLNILNKATNMGIRLGTPLMLTWGASDFQDPATGKGNGKFEMSMQFPSDEYKNDDTSAFLKNMIAFENKIKEDALVYSKEWFGKVHKNAEVVEALYSPTLKYSKDKNTGEPDYRKAPTMRVKIPLWEGVYKCEVYDEDFQKLFPSTTNPTVTPMELIQKGTNVASLIQCGGIWFANGKFGVTWKLVQVVVQKPRGALTGQCFIKLKTADKEKLKASVSPMADVIDEDDMPMRKNVDVEDSDDEDEVVAHAPAPAPAPVVVPAPVAVQEPVAEVASATEEPKKKKIIKKKVDA